MLSSAGSSARAFEVGGSDFVALEIPSSGGPDLQTNYLWRHPILSYDGPLVRSRLAATCAAGQRKVSTTLWYAPSCTGTVAPGISPDHLGVCAYSGNGGLSPAMLSNLTQFLSDVANQTTPGGRPCFDELQFRFAPWHSANPRDPAWAAGWRDDIYLQSWAFISSTRLAVEGVLQGSHVRRVYDLAAEEGGIAGGQTERYTRTLWQMYLSAFGVADTYGFSMIPTAPNAQRALAVYDQVGVRPSEYAFDVYDNAEFEAALGTLAYEGEEGKPIVVQEIFYDDTQTAAPVTGIFARAAQAGFPIRTVMQWPVSRPGTGVNVASTPSYVRNLPYSATPHVSAIGLGCADLRCGWVTGQHFSSEAAVYFYSPAGAVLGSVSGSSVYTRDFEVDFPIPANLYAQYTGAYVVVVNQFQQWNDAWTDPSYLTWR